ncbi:prefoldin subunit 1 isoform X2 [Anser cygnoides]|uniref:prefoldin subunit 1 isoform X2 n=1 Tax=Anser cygnoides TaxID=8845 RepID=UPI0020093362|nr:prefoldin subunit 1 isoform X2 [Anser cygnoides]
MAAPVDLELKKAFTELQAKVIDTQQKVKLADIQIEQLSKTKKHAHLTDTEIMMLVDETRMYEGVGRICSSLEIWDIVENTGCLRSGCGHPVVGGNGFCLLQLATFKFGTK